MNLHDEPTTKRLQNLCVALEQQVARYKDAHAMLSEAIRLLMSTLNSEEYRCRGGHWSRRLTDDEERNEYDAETNTDPFVYWQPPPDAHMIGTGDCTGTITISMESECDDMGYTLYSYPVAGGDCADAMRLDEDESYSNPIWAEMSQRHYLRGVLKQSLDWGYGRGLVRELQDELSLAQHQVDAYIAVRERDAKETAKLRWGMPREC